MNIKTTISKVAEINPTTLTNPLNMNELNTPVRNQRLAGLKAKWQEK